MQLAAPATKGNLASHGVAATTGWDQLQVQAKGDPWLLEARANTHLIFAAVHQALCM